jgi:glycosyltransferase involved in cell wall biosynthesis
VTELPKISVIVPTFNQGQFIEQTILSVISQQYPNLEFIVLDAGSSDNTVEIIRKYHSHITYWRSQADGGQAAAINEGFHRATGSILCWINSDDIYMPGIFRRIAGHFTDERIPKVVFGNSIHFDSESGKARGSSVSRNHLRYQLSLCDYVIQPSSFWNRAAWVITGHLNESMHFAFDWDWFIRAKQAGVDFVPVEECLSLYRIHAQHKSGNGGNKRIEELKSIVSTYNDQRLSEAFNKWMKIYGNNRTLSRILDITQRFNLSLPISFFRRLFFRSLNIKEYQSIISMK